MKRLLCFLLIAIITFSFCSSEKQAGSTNKLLAVDSAVMFLDAYGVESAGFPTIRAALNFKSNSGTCEVSYYEPWLKKKIYSLTQAEMDTVLNLLQHTSPQVPEQQYKDFNTDQPTSLVTVYAGDTHYVIRDYGLVAKYPFNELYRIVYKLEKNFR